MISVDQLAEHRRFETGASPQPRAAAALSDDS